MKYKGAESFDGIAQSEYVCCECRKTIGIGENFRQITSRTGSRLIISWYHLPQCPKLLRHKPTKRRGGDDA
jgi:hypothetical protein